MSDIYCGISNVPKGSRRGSMKQCADKGQIRYYGIKKIDSRLIQADKDTKIGMNREQLIYKIKKKQFKMDKYKRRYRKEKDPKKKKELKIKFNKMLAIYKDFYDKYQKKAKKYGW
jgi:hypothetical protein